MKQDWTEQLRTRMEGYEVPVPDYVWESVEASLNEAEQRRKARVVTWRRWVAAAAVTLLVITPASLWLLLGMRESSAPRMSQSEAVTEQCVADYAQSVAESGQSASKSGQSVAESGQSVAESLQTTPEALQKLAKADVEPRTVGAATPLPCRVGVSNSAATTKLVTPPLPLPLDGRGVAAPENPPTQGAISENPPTQGAISENPPVDDVRQAQELALQRRNEDSNALQRHNEDNNANEAPYLPRHKESNAVSGTVVNHSVAATRHVSLPQSRHSLTAGFRSSGLLASNTLGEQTSREQMVMTRSYFDPSFYANYGDLLGNQKLYLSDYYDETTHRQPVSFGLTVAMPLNNRLWAESGLTYMRVTSLFVTHLPSCNLERTQKLQYLGIPLDLGCRLWNSGRFTAYAVAGGEVHFNVKAKSECDGMEAELRKDRAMLSLSAHAGVELQLLPQLGVCVEPGLKYYFDNGSYVQNIFKERPWLFDLQLGVRYRLK